MRFSGLFAATLLGFKNLAHFAHLALCAAAILLRAATESLRLPRLSAAHSTLLLLGGYGARWLVTRFLLPVVLAICRTL